MKERENVFLPRTFAQYPRPTRTCPGLQVRVRRTQNKRRVTEDTNVRQVECQTSQPDRRRRKQEQIECVQIRAQQAPPLRDRNRDGVPPTPVFSIVSRMESISGAVPARALPARREQNATSEAVFTDPLNFLLPSLRTPLIEPPISQLRF